MLVTITEKETWKEKKKNEWENAPQKWEARLFIHPVPPPRGIGYNNKKREDAPKKYTKIGR